jgi:uncharacterized protein DUF4149
MLVALVVAAWLGAAILLSASVAPAAFAVLPSRMLAGALVARILPAVFVAGILVGALAAALSPTWRRAAALIMAVSCAAAQFAVGPRIDRLRIAIAGPVDALAATDPRRVAFGRLHGLSVALLGVAMLAALVIVFAAWRSYDSR